MKRLILALTLSFYGCSFQVGGLGGGGPSDVTGGAGGMISPTGEVSQPTESTPDAGADLAEPDLMPKLGVVGDACDDMHKCGPFLTCLKKLGTGPKAIDFPGGYCTRSCENTSCPGGSSCSDIGGVKICLADCTDTCRGMYSCCDSGDAKVCKPGNGCLD